MRRKRALAAILLASALANCAAPGAAPVSLTPPAPQSGSVAISEAQPAWAAPDPAMDRFLDDLIARMTLAEKIGQMTLLTSDWESTGPTMRDSYKQDIQAGKVGNIFNAYTARYTREREKVLSGS